MSFNSGKIKSFSAKHYENNNTNQLKNKQRIARLVDFVSIAPSVDGNGTIFVSELGTDGKKRFYQVRIDPESFERVRESIEKDPQKEKEINSYDYYGSLINKDLKDEIEKTKKTFDYCQMVLENTYRPEGYKNEEIDGEEYSFLYTSWIKLVKCYPSEVFPQSKAFKGIFTADLNRKTMRIRTFQHIDEKTVDPENKEQLSALLERLDKVTEAYKTDYKLPSVGVRLLACKKEKDGIISILETSGNFDWVSDESGEGSGQPFGSEHLKELIQEFYDYLKEEYNEDVFVRIMTYSNYFASSKSARLTVSIERYSPLFAMCKTPYKHSNSADDDYYEGKHHAVSGVIMLSSNYADQKTAKIIPRDIVNSFSPDTINGNVLAFLKEPYLKEDGSNIRYNIPLYLKSKNQQERANENSKEEKVDTSEKEQSNNIVNDKPKEEQQEPQMDFDDDIPF